MPRPSPSRHTWILQERGAVSRRRHQIGRVGVVIGESGESYLDPSGIEIIDNDFDDLYRLQAAPIYASRFKEYAVTGVELTTEVATVPHTLQQIPHGYHVTPRTAGVWFEARDKSADAIYLQASAGSMTVDIIIQG